MVVDDTITISMQEYIDLRRAYKKLTALEDGGVDNWEWYDEAMENYVEDD